MNKILAGMIITAIYLSVGVINASAYMPAGCKKDTAGQCMCKDGNKEWTNLCCLGATEC